MRRIALMMSSADDSPERDCKASQASRVGKMDQIEQMKGSRMGDWDPGDRLSVNHHAYRQHYHE